MFNKFSFCATSVFVSGMILGSASLHATTIVIPSPASDLLLSSNGGVADINGSTADGSANYGNLPAANLNDGDRDGDYQGGGNSNGVDRYGSIAHTSGTNAGTVMTVPIPNEMGVTIPTPSLIGSVALFNRTDCCNGRIDNNGTVPFTLNIYDGSTLVYTNNYTFNGTISLSATNPYTLATDTASGMVIPLPAGTIGTHVQIVQNYTGDYMNLAELEAYTPEPASLTLFGFGAMALLIRRR